MTTDMIVFFILGGPGSGKGTACSRLVQEFGFTHLSAGDLLREETKKEGSELGQQINAIISKGNIVPSEITVALLKKAIEKKESEGTTRGYLVDGFPRKFDQAEMFETGIAKALKVLYFDCTQETMEARCVVRAAETAAVGAVRSDDDVAILRNRFRVNIEQCMPVVEMYKQQGRCIVVDTNRDKDSVYAEVRDIIIGLGVKPLAF